jgi:zinc D-Ala-D-Ala dipeptidase
MVIECVSDVELAGILVVESGEKLVNVRDYSREIVIEVEDESRNLQGLGDDECFVRESVAIMLSRVQSLLPRGLRLKIIDGFRSISTQKKIYSQVFNEIREKNSRWTDKQIEEEADKWVANPIKTIPPHTTGGAVDLTMIDENLKELDFGTSPNSISAESATEISNISDGAKKNRQLMIELMSKVGFVNYPLEWWHWSYGDREWAYRKGVRSIYGSLENLTKFEQEVKND